MALRQPTFQDTDGFPEEMALTDELQLAALTMTGDIVMGGNQVTGLGAPSGDNDAATKIYVDNAINGLDRKESVRLATAAALPANTASGSGVGKTLTADANGALTVDGVAVSAGDRILVKDESTGADNGIYVVTDAGDGSNPYILTRTEDADEDSEVTAGMIVVSAEGTANADTGWMLTTDDPITVDTTSLTFTYFPVGSIVNAGAGLLKTANDIDIELDTDADAQGTGADGGSSGLEFDVTGDAGQLRVKVNPAGGIQRGASGLEAELDPAGAIVAGASGLAANVDGVTITINGSNELEVAAASEATRVENQFTANDNLSAGDPVFMNGTDDEAQQADAATPAEGKRTFGVAAASATATNPVDVISHGLAAGVLTGGGFTAGELVYLASGGGLTDTKPSGSGEIVVLMGYAINADDLFVQIEKLAINA